MLSGARRESAGHFCQLEDSKGSYSAGVFSISFLSGQTEQKGKQDNGNDKHMKAHEVISC